MSTHDMNMNMAMGGGDVEWISILKILGEVTELSCKHCGKQKDGMGIKKPIGCFENTLREWFKKGKLSSIRLPKTCDKMQVLNKAYNPYNNKIYSTLVVRAEAAVSKDAARVAAIDAELLELVEQKEKVLETVPRKRVVIRVRGNILKPAAPVKILIKPRLPELGG